MGGASWAGVGPSLPSHIRPGTPSPSASRPEACGPSLGRDTLHPHPLLTGPGSFKAQLDPAMTPPSPPAVLTLPFSNGHRPSLYPRRCKVGRELLSRRDGGFTLRSSRLLGGKLAAPAVGPGQATGSQSPAPHPPAPRPAAGALPAAWRHLLPLGCCLFSASGPRCPRSGADSPMAGTLTNWVVTPTG